MQYHFRGKHGTMPKEVNLMNLYERFWTMGEYYAAGLYEEPERSLFYRKALGLRRYYENLQAPQYTGRKLYPSGAAKTYGAVTPHYMNMNVNWDALAEKDLDAKTQFEQSEFFKYQSTVPSEHTVAGNMYTHSMANFERILQEGFDSYEQRIASMVDKELREGLQHLLVGIRHYHSRCVAYLESVDADTDLIQALKKVPFKPCTNIYEAVEGWNFILYLDNCDNMGSLASGLMPWFRGENIVELLENLYDNLNENGGYSMSLGMEMNPLVLQCIEASAGKRRPMIELFVDEKTPEEIWDAAMKCVLSGNGQPAFYNRKLYRQGFESRFPKLAREDFVRMCGGGCTEMMIAGLSNVGSLDAGINLLLILERYLKKALLDAESFDEFYRGYMECVHSEARRVMHEIANSQKMRSEWNPVPMRTLLVDDCIEKERDFNNGGARYQWSIISYAGIVNLVDSLLVIRDVIFENKELSKANFLEKLDENDPVFQQRLQKNKNRLGIDCEPAEKLAKEFTSEIFSYMAEEKTHFGWGFLPASIQFMAYAEGGRKVGATPCGRMAGDALADSLSAIFGKDTEGPTALLKSVTSMDLLAALGTPVVNLTVNKNCDPEILKGLIRGYLKLGGMQIQISCLSREELLDAQKHPEKHQNLIVRVGGYSEYFCRLNDKLKEKVLERTYYL